MIVEVEDDLPGAGTVVDLDPEVLAALAQHLAHLPYRSSQMPMYLRRRTQEILEVLFGADQKMNRRLRRNVMEDDDILVLIEDFGRR